MAKLRSLMLALVPALIACATDTSAADSNDLVFVDFEYANQPIPPELVSYVARFGARTSYRVIPGARLGTYVEALCGEDTLRNNDLFRETLKLQGTDVGADGGIKLDDAGTTLQFPPCLPAPKTERAPTFANREATLWGYFTRAGGENALGMPFGPAGQGVPTKLTSSNSDPGSGSATYLNSIGLDLNAYCGNTLSAPCSQDGPAIPSNDDLIVKEALKRAAKIGVAAERAVPETFLAGNELVRSGVDRDLVASALDNVLSGNDADAVKFALKQYSEPNGGLSAEQWKQVWERDAPGTSDTQSFQRSVEWIVPPGETRRHSKLALGDMVVTLVPVRQQTEIPIDLAAVRKFDTGSATESVKAAFSGASPAPEIKEQSGFPILSAASDQCTSKEQLNWGTKAFADEFLRTLAQSRVEAYLQGKHTSTAIIRILDSGFVSAHDDQDAFPDTLFTTSTTNPRDRAETEMGKDFTHGTAVAGVALGGPSLRGVLPALGIQIQIQPRKVYSTANGTTFLNYTKFESAFAESDVNVFNLSFTSTDEDKIFSTLTKYGKNKLIIVAAGNNNLNNADQGVDIGVGNLFPQSWGARTGDWPTLLTVGSLDGRKRASFSNYSKTAVRIAAPGCHIASWIPDSTNDHYVEGEFNGTSFSAPMVAYVAAIVAALAPEGANGSNQVAMRILASADLLPELDGIEDGRALNPIKAISLYEDVVDVVLKGTVTRLTGSFGDIHLDDFCKGGFSNPVDAKIIKIAKDPSDPTGKRFLYYLDKGGAFHSNTCEANATQLSLKKRGGERVTVLTTDIKDLVPRMQ
ncbi:S8 family peptidase [Mesorhizobium sp. M0179]|uniref:S8 family serine peptidase n=1 Tax=Mesorhizobium sp. M0179 TaxID=2956905 RepID=UPI003338041B